MLRITSHPVLSGLLLCLSFGTMSSFAAAQVSVSADLSAPTFSFVLNRNSTLARAITKSPNAAPQLSA